MFNKKEGKSLKFSREAISIRMLEIAQQLQGGSYKDAIKTIGRVCALSKTINDYYWEEKFLDGFMKEAYFLKSGMKDDHPDKSN